MRHVWASPWVGVPGMVLKRRAKDEFSSPAIRMTLWGLYGCLWVFLWVLMGFYGFFMGFNDHCFFSGAFYVMFAWSMYGPCKKGFRSLLFGKSGTDWFGILETIWNKKAGVGFNMDLCLGKAIWLADHRGNYLIIPKIARNLWQFSIFTSTENKL